MKKVLITATIVLMASLCTFAQNVDKLISQADITRIIKTLSADDMQGRASFTPGIEKAARFIENEYAAIGLQPLNGKNGYRQNFTMVSTMPIKTTATVNGVNIAADSVFSLSPTPFTWNNDSSVQIVHLGAGQNLVKEYLADVKSNKKMLVIVDPHFQKSFTKIWEYTRAGSVSFKKDSGLAVVFILGRFDNIKSFGVNYQAQSQEKPLFNIAGIIPGKTKPDEYVVFSGHYDHLGILKPMDGDSIANGADDDASGTTAVISLAKYYKQLNNNARTLIFVAFTAEEIGEYGSQYFATRVNPDQVVAMFNIEMIGKASKFGKNSAFITGFDRSDFGTILQKNLQGTSFKFYPDPYPAEDLFYRSDNASLAELGVPAHTISTDQIDIDKLYHTVKDEFGTLDVNNITATIKAIALSSRTIVSGQDTPKRVPKPEK